MRVLLLVTDLYKQVGGGQAVYRKIIESTPDVDFVYFRSSETAEAPRPANATAVELLAHGNVSVFAPPPYPSYRISQLREADRYARSVANETFDVVDTPDFHPFGAFLRSAFKRHNVKAGRIVLALHGNISTSIELNWGSAGNRVMELQLLEEEQFTALDGRYGISPAYIREWRERFDCPVTFIDPLHFSAARRPDAPPTASKNVPNLYCIGRTERRKGNDLFVELVRWLDPSTFGEASHIGDSVRSDFGHNSIDVIKDMARVRDISVGYMPSMTQSELLDLYSRNTVVVLPVRYDSLNLVALDTIFSGCPLVVSEDAGVCEYLDIYHSQLPYIKIRRSNIYAAVEPLQQLLKNYDRERRRLNMALDISPHRPPLKLEMKSVYEEFLETPASGRGYDHEDLSYISSYDTPALQPTPDRQVKRLVRSAVTGLESLVDQGLSVLRSQKLIKNKEAEFDIVHDAKSTSQRLKEICYPSENSLDKVNEKLSELYRKGGGRLFRCNFWLEAARLNRIKKNDFVASAYELRLLRLLDAKGFTLNDKLLTTLGDRKYAQESVATTIQFDGQANRDESVYRFLKTAYSANKALKQKPWEIVRDKRSELAPRVSVIVSLYNAAGKLELFLTALSEQTLVKSGTVEIILVDSGSPSDELGVFERFMLQRPLNAIFARSAERETIQAAWNRGIGISRAPYLVFLGVDEAVYPECLEMLSRELDRNPHVDWVMSNSLVTAVDENGRLKNDIMSYDRTGATKDHTYLETCYLSWVGGMYRRAIHENYGYYDETFRAAGDTEFKNRVLPHINVKFVPRVLGLFLNYPEGQTTASPVAEIEDSRAWYVYRTPGGVRYAFENRSLEEAEQLLLRCLSYRKSYCRHISTDFELAAAISDYVLSQNPQSSIASVLSPGLKQALAQLRQLDFLLTTPTEDEAACMARNIWTTMKKVEASHAPVARKYGIELDYRIFNDNRYEQHSWFWI
jgi:glycosyltransferase involved in cell wall biosynthesis